MHEDEDFAMSTGSGDEKLGDRRSTEIFYERTGSGILPRCCAAIIVVTPIHSTISCIKVAPQSLLAEWYRLVGTYMYRVAC